MKPRIPDWIIVIINKVAKAIANDKVGDVEEACQKFLTLQKK